MRARQLSMALAVLLSTSAASAQVINEIRINAAGANDQEFIEIAGPAGEMPVDVSLVVIGDGAGGSGTVEEVIDLSTFTFDTNGFITIAEADAMTGNCDDKPGVTSCVPALNFENNDNVTYFLVEQFAAAVGDDLDVDDNGVLGIDIDDDGVEDTDPWTTVLDRIAVIEKENPPDPANDWHYGPPTIGPFDNGGTDVAPGHVYRCGAEWFIGEFDYAMGVDSPAMANPCAAPGPDAGPMDPDAGPAVGQPDAGFTIEPSNLTARDQPGIICSVGGGRVWGWLPVGVAMLLGIGAMRRRN